MFSQQPCGSYTSIIYLVDNAIIVDYVEHIVHDKALQCFKETFFELLVRDSCVWTSLISRYVEHDSIKKCIPLDYKNLFEYGYGEEI